LTPPGSAILWHSHDSGNSNLEGRPRGLKAAPTPRAP
jgi:hypothetical protein